MLLWNAKIRDPVAIVSFPREVYIVLGIDENEHDQVLAVFDSYPDAKQYCCKSIKDSGFYDLWIEKHSVM